VRMEGTACSAARNDILLSVHTIHHPEDLS
jgi:hypothetical protein